MRLTAAATPSGGMVAVPRVGAIGPRAKRGARAFPSLSTGEEERRPAAAAAATAAKRCRPCIEEIQVRWL
jgi:hypothetical protein